jgi:3-oxoacyl-[acyl-carrier-protein] synthase II
MTQAAGPRRSAARRVAVTGIGVRCAGAADAAEFWTNVLAGLVAVGPVEGLPIGDSACRIGGQIKDLPYSGTGDPQDRVAQLLLPVAAEALRHSGIDLGALDPARAGVALGQCQGGFADGEDAHFVYSSADLVAGEFGLVGPRPVLSTACTAGTAALAQAAELISSGEADLMLACGVDELLGPTWVGFASLDALSPAGCEAYSASKGLVLGEVRGRR